VSLGGSRKSMSLRSFCGSFATHTEGTSGVPVAVSAKFRFQGYDATAAGTKLSSNGMYSLT
jgi:hypothetical protein